MGILELLLIAVGVSMDAFAVSIGKGLTMSKVDKKQAFTIALFFGGFQALMPFLGWLLGSQFAALITSIDHWIAFLLLVFIGAKMVVDAVRAKEENASTEMDKPLDYRELFMLAIATSIDALAVGITFAFLGVDIVFSITVIGLTTFAFSLVGVFCGHAFGSRYEKSAGIIGGVVLIVIGFKILFEHLGILPF
ncbi:MAG: manganese efflux pump MntP family protein [Eggerthellaceae bacterium]|jgi:putative Mn2+ efflux pump MntP